jgi:hypothetical protein
MSASAAARCDGSSDRTFSYARGRAVRLALLGHPELGGLHQERHLGGVVGLLRLLRLEQADELVPLAALGVEDLEVVPLAERQVLLLQRLLGLAVARVQGEQLAPGVDRLLVVAQALAVELPELSVDLLLLRRLVRDLDLALEHLGELLELLGALVQVAEGAERLGVLAVALEHLLPEADADLGLLHPLVREPRDLEELRRALGAVREPRRLTPVQADELLPVPPLLVALPEEVEGGLVRLVDGEDGLVRLHGLGRVGELRRVELGRLEVEGELLVGIVDRLGELDEGAHVLVEALGRLLLLGAGAQLVHAVGVDRRRGRGRRGGRGRGRRGRRGRGRGRRGRRLRRSRAGPRRRRRGLLARGRRRRCGSGRRLGGRRRRRGGSRRGLRRLDLAHRRGLVDDRLGTHRRPRLDRGRHRRRGRHRGGRRHGLRARRERLADLQLERRDARVLRGDQLQALEPAARLHQVPLVAPRDGAALGEQVRRLAAVLGDLLDQAEDAVPVALLGAPEVA